MYEDMVTSIHSSQLLYDNWRKSLLQPLQSFFTFLFHKLLVIFYLALGKIKTSCCCLLGPDTQPVQLQVSGEHQVKGPSLPRQGLASEFGGSTRIIRDLTGFKSLLT